MKKSFSSITHPDERRRGWRKGHASTGGPRGRGAGCVACGLSAAMEQCIAKTENIAARIAGRYAMLGERYGVMGNKVEKTMNAWQADAEKFTGDRAMFWAGKMSLMIWNVARGGVRELSVNVAVAELCKEEYDRIIFGRT